MRTVTAEMMQAIDRRAQKQYRIPGLILMEHAGQAAADEVLTLLSKRRKKSVCIFCGPGNNAGDGLVVARLLSQARVRVRTFLLAGPEKLHGDARLNFDIVRCLKIPWRCCRRMRDLRYAQRSAASAGLIVDAIFGIGLNKPVGGMYCRAIDMMNASTVPILSLDTPSGLCATTGGIWGTCVRATVTVTFGLAKSGFYAGEGPRHTGKIVVADIGLPRPLLACPRPRRVSPTSKTACR